jgi:hypothetical protein
MDSTSSNRLRPSTTDVTPTRLVAATHDDICKHIAEVWALVWRGIEALKGTDAHDDLYIEAMNLMNFGPLILTTAQLEQVEQMRREGHKPLPAPPLPRQDDNPGED